jgi:hypothetical protein
MDRNIPMFNRVVAENMQRKHIDLHQQRIYRIKVIAVQV